MCRWNTYPYHANIIEYGGIHRDISELLPLTLDATCVWFVAAAGDRKSLLLRETPDGSDGRWPSASAGTADTTGDLEDTKAPPPERHGKHARLVRGCVAIPLARDEIDIPMSSSTID
jgi:hypothetical protein